MPNDEWMLMVGGQQEGVRVGQVMEALALDVKWTGDTAILETY